MVVGHLAAGGKSTVDITAMALTALSGIHLYESVQSSVDPCLALVDIGAASNGGFNDSGDNSESAAQVMIALSALRIDMATFEQQVRIC